MLELASGSGEMTLALARLASERREPLEITGSDIVETYVEDARRRAAREGVAARFRTLNAFDLSELERGELDVAFIVQSIHHFSAGQLAMMIAQVGAAGARVFVGIDGHRSLFLLAALGTIGALGLDYHFAHDAVVSARRLYSEPELELIGRIAAPEGLVSVHTSHPGMSVLTVRYPERAGLPSGV